MNFFSFSQNVGIGILSPAGKLHIKGSTDVSQLIIDANTTQSNLNPLFKLRKSDGTDLMWIHSDDSTNCFVGLKAGKMNNPSGKNNSFFGASAGRNNSTGNFNIAIGSETLYSNTIGYGNTATGYKALTNNTTGFYNTANGHVALLNNTTGSQNIAIGVEALLFNTEGNNNTAVGVSAGIQSGLIRNNTVTVGYNSITSENNLALLGNTTTTINGGYGIAGWVNFSDGRFKKNIKENVPGLEFIIALRPVTYTLDLHGLNQFIYKDKTAEYEIAMAESIAEKEKIVQTGFIAQEVEQTAKKIGYDFDGVIVPKDSAQSHYMIGYASFVVPLVKAVQEQEAIIENQQTQIDALLKRIETLEKK